VEIGEKGCAAVVGKKIIAFDIETAVEVEEID